MPRKRHRSRRNHREISELQSAKSRRAWPVLCRRRVRISFYSLWNVLHVGRAGQPRLDRLGHQAGLLRDGKRRSGAVPVLRQRKVQGFGSLTNVTATDDFCGKKRNTKDDPNLFLCLAFKALTTLRQNYGSTNSKSRYVYIFKHIFVEEYWHIFWYLSNFRFEQFGFTLTERKLSNLIENMNKFD